MLFTLQLIGNFYGFFFSDEFTDCLRLRCVDDFDAPRLG